MIASQFKLIGSFVVFILKYIINLIATRFYIIRTCSNEKKKIQQKIWKIGMLLIILIIPLFVKCENIIEWKIQKLRVVKLFILLLLILLLFFFLDFGNSEKSTLPFPDLRSKIYI